MRLWLAGIGVAGTAAYLWLVWLMLGQKLGDFQWLELNEAGDFLAGVFGPLSLFWLILGFFQQGYELRQNAEALHLQAKELNNSVEQQRQMVLAAKEANRAALAQLELETKRVKEDREAFERTNRPRFFFNHGSISQGSEGSRWEVQLRNGGRDCTEVRVQLAPTTGLALSGATATPHLGGTGYMTLQLSGPAPARDTPPSAMTVNYTSAIGIPGVVTFEVQVKSGELLIRPTE